MLIYAGVGVVVARRQPRNPIGWILISFIVLFLLSTVVGWYAALYYRFGHHGLPLAGVAVILQPLWAPALLLFPVVMLLFPDGRLASRRWRWMLPAYTLPGRLDGDLRLPRDRRGRRARRPPRLLRGRDHQRKPTTPAACSPGPRCWGWPRSW